MDEKVVTGIVVRGTDILIVRRKKGEGNLFWQFPGGTVESGETEEQTVVRELYEETGLVVAPVERLGARVHPSTNRYISYWVCNYISGELSISDDDLDAVEWVGKDELMDYFTTPIYPAIIGYLNI